MNEVEIIMDTNVVSELLRPKPDPIVAAWVIEYGGSGTYITAINEAELRQGISLMKPGRKRDRLTSDFEEILRRYFAEPILPFDSAAAKIHADIVAAHRRAKRKVGFADCQIAAIARLHNAAVATRNVKHFIGSGIKVIDPWQPGGRAVAQW